MTILSGPASVIVDATSEAISAAQQISDPIERALSIENAARNLPWAQNQFRRARAAAIREALNNRSAVDVAAELGVSRSRLYKIIDDA